jgi:hypothetical protein
MEKLWRPPFKSIFRPRRIQSVSENCAKIQMPSDEQQGNQASIPYKYQPREVNDMARVKGALMARKRA